MMLQVLYARNIHAAARSGPNTRIHPPRLRCALASG